MNRDELLKRVTDFYLGSRDFNGVPFRELVGPNDASTLSALKEAILAEEVSVVFGDGHPNAHIRALPEHHSQTKQAELLEGPLTEHACVYPLRKHLERMVSVADYEGRPYALALALGEPSLTYRAFDLSVLENYRNDPRYHYDCDDIHGTLSVSDEHYEAGTMKKSDKVIIQAFGFAYDEDFNKYVAVFLWDLFRLSPEHQRFWQTKEIDRKTKLHPDYYRSAILGEFPERVSIYQAFIEELQVINKMAAAMSRPPFFRNDYAKAGRPREFASLLRPTVRDFNEFVHLLDKMMSDNINKDFFMNEVPYEDEVERKDKKIEVRQRGTIQLLASWLERKFRPKDPAPLKEMLDAFREVRKLRQKPAHAIDENRFDQKHVRSQQELTAKAYAAVRTLRLILANHPAAKAVEISDWLREGRIWPR